MKRSFVCAIGAVLVMIAFTVAQEKNASSAAPQGPSSQQDVRPPARETYRLEYTITEMEDGKKLNARSYSVVCEDRGGTTRGVLKVGSRVPIVTGGTAHGDSPTALQAQFQYLDIGMNIIARLDVTASGDVTLDTDMDMSSVANGESPARVDGNPVIRQLHVSSFNAITVGKPVVISTADDVASIRQFQIQVVAKKLK
jgi:hypothetical protein